MFYFGYGDNCNAKQLYYYCKKNRLQYPFLRAFSKGLLIDHKIVVAKVNQESRYGLITTESSLGHIVPGIVFELHNDTDLSIFGNEFEKECVQCYPNQNFVEVLLNKRESSNILDTEKAKLSKGRKKTIRQAIKWRNLERFEACYESAMSNFMYPYLIRHLYFPNNVVEIFGAEFKFDEYNSVFGRDELNVRGRVYFSNHLNITKDLRRFDKVASSYELNRVVKNVDIEGKKVLAWCVN